MATVSNVLGYVFAILTVVCGALGFNTLDPEAASGFLIAAVISVVAALLFWGLAYYLNRRRDDEGSTLPPY
jgi:hypothetical protein